MSGTLHNQRTEPRKSAWSRHQRECSKSDHYRHNRALSDHQVYQEDLSAAKRVPQILQTRHVHLSNSPCATTAQQPWPWLWGWMRRRRTIGVLVSASASISKYFAAHLPDGPTDPECQLCIQLAPFTPSTTRPQTAHEARRHRWSSHPAPLR